MESSTMETYFKTTPSKSMTIAGWGCTLLLLGIGGLLLGLGLFHFFKNGERAAILGILGGLQAFLILVGFLLFRPLGYRLTPTALVVRRWGPKVTIPLAEIREARRIKLTKVLRTCGVGGFFGGWGQFSTDDRSNGFGNFTAYLTRNDTEVAIYRKKGEPIVLSPDQPEAFIAALMERIDPGC
jgi:hypothetical protein